MFFISDLHLIIFFTFVAKKLIATFFLSVYSQLRLKPVNLLPYGHSVFESFAFPGPFRQQQHFQLAENHFLFYLLWRCLCRKCPKSSRYGSVFGDTVHNYKSLSSANWIFCTSNGSVIVDWAAWIFQSLQIDPFFFNSLPWIKPCFISINYLTFRLFFSNFLNSFFLKTTLATQSNLIFREWWIPAVVSWNESQAFPVQNLTWRWNMEKRFPPSIVFVIFLSKMFRF